MARCARLVPRDLLLGAALYLYFSLGFLFVVLPRMLMHVLCCRGEERHRRIQRLVSRFFRGFFRVATALGRPTTIVVSEEVRQLRGRILVCNHESYLDPLLFIATFERHSTAAKPFWFRVPIFSSMMRALGYLAPAERLTSLAALSRRIEAMRGHLASGGVLFLFPEGRRSRDGSIGRFHPGAFKLARHLEVDVELLQVQDTAALFPPGRVFFRTGSRARIRLERLGSVTAKELAESGSLQSLVREVRARYDARRAPPGEDAA